MNPFIKEEALTAKMEELKREQFRLEFLVKTQEQLLSVGSVESKDEAAKQLPGFRKELETVEAMLFVANSLLHPTKNGS